MAEKENTSQADFNDAIEKDHMDLLKLLHNSTGISCADLDPIVDAMLSGDETSTLLIDSTGEIYRLDGLESRESIINSMQPTYRMN